MLTEDQVVDAVCNYLNSQAWEIKSCSHTTEHGIDIVARRGTEALLVEAKGETSNKANSKRYGKPFNRAQCRDHVANALYVAAAMIGKGQTAIALPDTPLHRHFIDKVGKAIAELGIWVFWVTQNCTVSCQRML